MAKISNENELFKIIRDVLSYPEGKDAHIGVNAMDDCALIKIDEQRSLAVTSDFVRGSGFTLFKLGYMNYFDVGFYLISANLSDLASIGAKPAGLTTVIRYADMDDVDFKAVFEGMKSAADLFDTPIIGGDIGSYKADVFTATAFGFVDTDKAMLRKNVQPDDLLCLTGVVGKPFTAMIYFREKERLKLELSPEEEQRILSSWKKPTPRINQGMLLSSLGYINGCQDISDGLKATIGQLAKSSGQTFSIQLDKIPVDSATVSLGKQLNVNHLELAMSASVDFELAFTLPRHKFDHCEKVFKENGYEIYCIGEVNQMNKNVGLNSNGKETQLPGIAFDQRPIEEIINEIIK